jgi:hypothetical protein
MMEKNPIAVSAPLKVYIFAGQSNMTGSINKDVMEAYDPAIKSWLQDADNPVLYSYWKDDESNASTDWERLDQPTQYGWEHIAAYHLWKHWQSVDTDINVAIFIVGKGGTSLKDYWTAGGRDRFPWQPSQTPRYMPQGEGYQTLTKRLRLALQQLDHLGHTNRSIESLFWYQGEGDSNDSFGGDNYRVLFEDLVHGWEDRSAVDFPNDHPSEYGGSLRNLLGLNHLPTFTARISRNIKGSPTWDIRSKWESHLADVRAALVDYTQSHPDCAWVDVDDIPLKDYFHYAGTDYCEIGDRMAQAYLETLDNNASVEKVRTFKIVR